MQVVQLGWLGVPFLAIFALDGVAGGGCEGQWNDAFGQFEANSSINAMSTFDDGDGTNLYIGGGFGSISGVQVNGIAKWDGYSWHGLQGGLPCCGVVNSFLVENGDLDSLIVGGNFQSI